MRVSLSAAVLSRGQHGDGVALADDNLLLGVHRMHAKARLVRRALVDAAVALQRLERRHPRHAELGIDRCEATARAVRHHKQQRIADAQLLPLVLLRARARGDAV